MLSTYTPKKFGELIGKATKTLQKWDREGRLKAHRSPPSNRRFYTHDQYLEYMGLKARNGGKTIVYARVSTAAQKPDLANQTAALQADCEARQIKVDEWMQDIGSGLNYKRSMARIFGTDIRSSQHRGDTACGMKEWIGNWP